MGHSQTLQLIFASNALLAAPLVVLQLPAEHALRPSICEQIISAIPTVQMGHTLRR